MGFELLGFVAVVLLAYLIPGPDFLLVSRYSVLSKRLGFSAALGAQSGLCVHMIIAAMGLSAIAARSAELFLVMRWVGAAYLIWLGFNVLRKSQYRVATNEILQKNDVSEHHRAFANGFLTNLLNPKAMIFFLSVLPQFMDPNGDAVRQVSLHNINFL